MKKETPKAAPAKAAKPFDPHDVSGQTLADLLGLTRQRILHLKQNGTIAQNGKRGRYDIFECAPRYVQSIKTSGTAEARLITREDAARVLAVPYECITHLSKDLPKTLASSLAKARTRFEVRSIINKGFGEVRAKLVAELKECCGIDPNADFGEVKARLRKYEQ